MSEIRIIRDRPPRLSRGHAGLGVWALALAASATTLACELVIGDAPHGRRFSLPDAGPEASFAVGGKTGSGGAAPIHAGGAHAAGGATAQAGSGSALGSGGVAGTRGARITATGGGGPVYAGGARGRGMPIGTARASPRTNDD